MSTSSAPGTAAAAPRLIMFYGHPLTEPVVLDDWSENLRLMVAIDRQSYFAEATPEGRPAIKVAFFWGPRWVRYVEEGRPLDRLDPREAKERGVYYPAVREGAAGVIVMDLVPDALMKDALHLPVGGEAAEILQKRGLPVVVRRGPA